MLSFRILYLSQPEKFSEAFGLSAADGNFGLFLIVHAQLVGTLEPGDDFLDAINIHQVRTMGAPEEVGVQAVQ